MTTPTLRRLVSLASVGVVVVAPVVGATTSPAFADEASSQAARFILSNVMPVSDSPTPTERSAGVVAKRTIGYSVKGTPIVARMYGSPTASRVGVFIGSMHGDELGGVPIAKRLEKVGAPSNTGMWVLRNLNPDGSKRGIRGNANKVDLNRNGTQDWSPTSLGGKLYYPGPAPASEPETRAYIDFLTVAKPDVVLVYHQHGNGVDSYRQKTPSLTSGLAARMGLKVKSFDCLGVCRGTLAGWFNTTQQGTAIVVELPAKVTAKKVKRWANAARWSIGSAPDVS